MPSNMHQTHMAFGGTHMASGGLALTTDWSKCFIYVNYSTQFLQDCDHEEADTRLALHLFDAIDHGARNILVRTVDTDVIVILIDLFFYINSSAITTTIWVAFGTGRNFRYYNINNIINTLGADKSRALPFFHTFSGCDTTSQFHGKGKKSVWDAWKSYPCITASFAQIVSNPFKLITVQSEVFTALERFTCIFYDKTTEHSSVNGLQKELFSRHTKLIENFTPTQVKKIIAIIFLCYLISSQSIL